MRTLTERDAAALLSVAAELAALDDAVDFPPDLLGRIAALVRTPEAGYSVLDRASETTIRYVSWCEGGGASETGGDDAAYWRLRHTHPCCRYREHTSDWTSTRMVSDFMTEREFRRTAIWDELYRDAGISYWLDVGLRPIGSQTRVFVFARDKGAFGERDRLVLDLLQPYLQQRYDRVQAAAEAVDALASLDESHDDEPGHVVLCSRDGAIEFASQESRRLLAAYLGANGRLPEPVLVALRTRPLVVERDGRRLTLRAAPAAGLHVVLLGEEDVRLDRLTPRQRTILEHVARGETDSEVGAALGIARATVNKHLENIFARLDVHTRTAAAALAAGLAVAAPPDAG